MNLDQFFSSFQASLDSPTLDTDYASQCNTSAVQPLPQPSCSNEILDLLNAFCSDEDTVKSYLLDGGELNNQNNGGQQIFNSSIGICFSSNDWANPSDSLGTIENLNSPTLDTDYASQYDTLDVQPLPQPSCSNQSLDLLKAFCSNEDTVKSYLLNDDELDNDNTGGQYFNSSIETLNSPIENSISNDPNSRSDGLGTIGNLSPVPTPIPPYISTDPLVVESLYKETTSNPYNILKLNFISLVKRGYKLILSLNTGNNEADEPWNPNVSQKILSVYFSSLSLRSEYLSTDVKLDGFESLLMDEACAAFKDEKYLSLFENLNDKNRARANPDKLISICNGIKGYRKIATSDKITLLSNIYYHLHTMDGIINYDATIDGWDAPASDFNFDRRDIFIFNKSFHNGIVHVLETFPDRFRDDINAIILIYLIIIFNADTSRLKHPEMIRHEQFSYIYLLRRYLRTICESDCEASDNHYRLMVKIEQLRLLTNRSKKGFFLLLNEPLVESITKAIKLDYLRASKICNESDMNFGQSFHFTNFRPMS